MVLKMARDKDYSFVSPHSNKIDNLPLRRSARLRTTPQCSQEMKKERDRVVVGRGWKPSEKQTLIVALRKYGCSDFKKLARAVRSRSINEIKDYMKKRMDHVRNSHLRVLAEKNIAIMADQDGQTSTKESVQKDKEDEENDCLTSETCATGLSKEEVHYNFFSKFPTIEKWKRIVGSNIARQHKGHDCSFIMADLFKMFGEATKELNIIGAPSLKDLYKFFEDTLNGCLPASLSPCNAFFVDFLGSELNKFLRECDTAVDFMMEFDGSKIFVPESVIQKENGEADTSKTVSKAMAVAAVKSVAGKDKELIVSLPDELYELYWRHQKIKENINPMSVSPWLLQDMNVNITKWVQRRFPKFDPDKWTDVFV